MEAGEREWLKTFLDEFEREIDYVLQEEHSHWFPPDLLDSLRPAWNDVRQRLSGIKSAIDDPENESRLEEEGFSGDQLQAKRA
jgi:hypothetical protein